MLANKQRDVLSRNCDDSALGLLVESFGTCHAVAVNVMQNGPLTGF